MFPGSGPDRSLPPAASADGPAVPGHPRGAAAAEVSGETEESRDPGQRWMEDFRRGDEQAFDHLVEAYQLSVYRFILRTVRDRGRAEDLTQEVFVRVFQARTRYRPTAKFSTWLFTIAHRLGLNELRAQRRRRWFLSSRDSADTANDPVTSAESPATESVAEQLERKELEGVIESLLKRLPPNQQAAFRLLVGEKLTYEEIATVLAVSVSAVKSLLVRGRESLRRGVERYLAGNPGGAEDEE